MEQNTRLIIKNLPKKITEDKIRSLFGEAGLITDVQLKYTAEGKFRQFGFVGFQTPEEAEAAVKRFDGSRLSTSKITVETCALLGDEKKPKSWSKYAADSTAYKIKHAVKTPKEEPDQKDEVNAIKQDTTAELLEKYKDDPKFEEFMQLHLTGDTQKLLDKKLKVVKEEDSVEEETPISKETPKLALQKISDLDYMKHLVKGKNGDVQLNLDQVSETTSKKHKLFTLKLRGLPYNCKKKNLKDFFRPVVPFSIRIPRSTKGFAYVGFKKEKQFKQALLKDKSFMNGKQIYVAVYTDQSIKEEKINEDPKKFKWKTQEESLKNEEDIAESGRIFIRNLSYTTTEDDIEKLFSKYGPITEINLPVDFNTRKLKGFGVITFLMPEHAVRAYGELDGSVLHGRMLHLLPGKAKDVPDTQEEDSANNYKTKKSAKDKAQAGSSHNWNSLFLGHDAVADVMAKSYGTSKEAVLDPHGSSNAAVRLALGETQIVANTKKYLEEEGVHLDAFNEAPVKRSKTILLAKNLPAETTVRELKELFEKFGVIGRIILPPNCITALVEFLEPSEAKKAFTKLAYTKFKYLPLYLEWAPENSLSSKPSVIKTKQAAAEITKEIKPTDNEKVNVPTLKEEAKKEEQEEEEEEPEPDTTLFVKNLNFKTTDIDLRKHFESCGKLSYATVATKKDVNDPSNKLSMGYGFVRFMYKTGANQALKTFQGSTLHGKSLELKRSERTLQNEVVSKKKSSKLTKQNGTKILVRNVPFQANRKEITELFQVFGEIRALRLPKKATAGEKQHRGFAFVDYFTNSDAKKAFEALSQSTHLYGRRLVLEWASSEEGVDEIRKRTASHFHPTEDVRSKKSVLDVESNL